jgi:hypothetical protein
MLACLCNFGSNEVSTLRFDMREELREDSPHVARCDLFGPKDELLCRRGDTPQFWMLHGSVEHELKVSEVQETFRNSLVWKHLWDSITRE